MLGEEEVAASAGDDAPGVGPLDAGRGGAAAGRAHRAGGAEGGVEVGVGAGELQADHGGGAASGFLVPG